MPSVNVQFKDSDLVCVLQLASGEYGRVEKVFNKPGYEYLLGDVVKRIGGYPFSLNQTEPYVVGLTSSRYAYKIEPNTIMVRRIPKGSKITIEV
jgi:hypothetical protein